MKATRKTIPALARDHKEFTNGSGTLRGILDPQYPQSIGHGTLNQTEKDKLRIDNDTAGLAYVIVSYETPIAWVTKTGWTYKVRQQLTQTSEQHLGLLFDMPEGFDPSHIVAEG